jgi:hypothetical protein
VHGQNVSVNSWINAAQAQDRALQSTGASSNAYRYNAQTQQDFQRANPEARAAQVEDAWRRSNGLSSFRNVYKDFRYLKRSAIPEDLLRKEIDSGN